MDSGSKSLNGIRAVVGKRTVDVPQTLGCDVISHAGLGLAVVDVACDAINPECEQFPPQEEDEKQQQNKRRENIFPMRMRVAHNFQALSQHGACALHTHI